ncbi:L-gulonolactone oxidase [Eurytemora carolleeae]|uniref:L-gulonolactone oxidase n=1 Tax=Eurytemora carolleeae TaxID=1294199 RepID=UPI000C77A244|nr:L-gulonolactone oxidase [Eurytemora carolleeae]|eukprot:XP_023332500.1 L-gulonolactone oxidase-like [Eurytemora affinis]
MFPDLKENGAAMNLSVLNSLVSAVKQFFINIFFSPPKGEYLYPRCGEDVLEILTQARDNKTQVKVVGGSFPLSSESPEDVILNLNLMNKLIGLDVHQQTVIAEPGMLLSHLSALLETVNLSLDLAGTVPDLSIVDAIAVGLAGCGGTLAKNILSVEVALPGADGGRSRRAELNSWSWTTNPAQMSALFSGLGLVAVVIAVTFKCIPLYRVTEVSYLTSLRDILETWSLVHRTSFSQQLIWYPFSELVILTHTSNLNRNVAIAQSFINRQFSNTSRAVARFIRKINLFLFSSAPILSSVLARIQFISLWSVAKNRSDYAHPSVSYIDCDILRGATWLLPLASLPPLLCSISQWSHSHPAVVSSPLLIYTIQGEGEGRVGLAPYLQPSIEGKGAAATVWYDWFLSDSSPDPLELAQFEEMFHS